MCEGLVCYGRERRKVKREGGKGNGRTGCEEEEWISRWVRLVQAASGAQGMGECEIYFLFNFNCLKNIQFFITIFPFFKILLKMKILKYL